MLKRLHAKRLILLLFAVGLALSCRLITDLTAGDDPGARYGAERGSSLVLAGGQPRTLDPALTLEGPDSAVGHIFSGLVQFDQSLRLQPGLAAGWEIGPDGLTYTFYLRRDALFHDGRPVTAADVAFAWRRALEPGTGSDTAATYLGDIEGALAFHAGTVDVIDGLRVVDDHILTVRLATPTATFLAKLTMPVAMVVDETNVAEPDWERSPNGTGPYRLEAWEDDALMVLERNERYYGGAPALTHVVIRMGDGIPLSLYENGEIDMVWVGGSTLERLRDPNNPLSAQLQTGVDLCTTFVGFDADRPPFDDARVRRAFTLAIDRPALARTLSQGSALPAQGPLPPGMPGYQDPTGIPFDIDAAQALLREAGYASPADMPEITFATGGYGDPGPLVTTLITRWRENLGVTVTPELIDPFLYFDALYDHPGQLYTFGWCADYPDPESFLEVLFWSESSQNLGAFAEPEVDALLIAARGRLDAGERLALYAAAESTLIEAAPAVFISHSLSAVLVSPALDGYVLTPIGVPQWHLLTRR
jgi:oligopeptide transport system substrate-binding protein